MDVTVGLVDDHILLRDGLAKAISELGYTVLLQADDGIDLQERLHKSAVPDIFLIDINMPRMDGYDTTCWLRKNHSQTKIIALSMYDDENTIIKMLRSGAVGYLLKDSHPKELEKTLFEVKTNGYSQSKLVTASLLHSIHIQNKKENENIPDVWSLSVREVQFLKLACTELTYKEIAEQLCVSPRTVDGYRDDLFQKLQVKSRVGLVLFSIKNRIIQI